jgi:hypothetical protein
VDHPDPIKIAGGAKCLASPEPESDREFVLDQIRKSMRLHETKRVILMVHSDGAYFVDFEGIWDAEVTPDSRQSPNQATA